MAVRRPFRTPRVTTRAAALAARGRRLGASCTDPSIVCSLAVGGLVAAPVWTAYGWSLPSTAAELVGLGLTAAKIAAVLAFLALYAVVPRLVAGRVLTRHDGATVPRADGGEPDAREVVDG